MDLLDLPQGLLHGILRRAGLRSRLACKALAHAYGSLHSLTPRGVTTTRNLLSALAARRRHEGLRALNLQHTADVVTDGTLQVLCEALPSLQELWLPDSSRLSLPRVAGATSSLTCLTALHLPCATAAQVPTAEIVGRLSRLQALTLPAASMPMATSNVSQCTALTQLCFSTAVGDVHGLEVAALALWAGLLPALVSLELDACAYTPLVDAAQLRALTALHTLKLARLAPEATATTGEVLQHIGSLTALRSLHLRLVHTGWTPAERGWLSRLSLLTSLHVSFTFADEGDLLGGEDDADDAVDTSAAALDEVACAVPRLPALAELRICDFLGRTAINAPSAAACMRIAAAGSTLRLLHLQGLALPPAATAALLPRLTSLTCLRLRGCEGLDAPPAWLAALTNLRELCCDSWAEDCLPPSAVLAGLTDLGALSIQGVDGPYLARLCAVMPQLTCLDLGGAHYGAERGSGLAASGPAALRPLQLLTNLEVLDLSLVVQPEQVRGLKGVPSLRRCHIGARCPASLLRRAAAALGQHVDVVSSTLQPPWW